MGETDDAAVKHSSLAKGVIAGLVGGLAGVVAWRFAERVFTPRTRDESVLSGEGASRDGLEPAADARPVIRWGYGAAAGAAYGALAEFYPDATARQGASFGLALEAIDREAALTTSGMAVAVDESARERGSEMTSHVIYGVATELVRRLVRRWL